MRFNSYTANIAALCFIFIGTGHLLADTFMHLIAPITDTAFIEVINIPRINLMGRLLSYAELSAGFSKTFGVLMLAFGFIQWGNLTRKSYFIGLLTAIVLSILSVQYFYIIPIVTMILATILYSFLLLKKELK